jgi:phosphoglycolate phosphatase
MNAFDLIVFDLDGTLVDSRRDLADSVNAMLAEFGAAPLAEDVVASMVGDGAKQLVERALARAGVAADADAVLPHFLDLYDERLVVHTKPYDGMLDALEVLAARDIRLAVFTNKPQAAADRVMAALDLAKWFRAGVLGAEGAYPCKPDPAGLFALAGGAGTPLARTLMVGDARQDVETARRAGAGVCVARYGFGFATAEPLLDGSELVNDTPAELLDRLSVRG